MSQEESLESALKWKERGNVSYGKSDFKEAIKAYEKGLDLLQDGDSSTEMALRANLAMVLLKLKDFERADKECSHILSKDPENTKVLYRRASAREGIALDLDDSNPSSQKQLKDYLSQAMEDLKQCLDILDTKKQDDKQKSACQSALGRLEKTYNQAVAKHKPKKDDASASETAISDSNSSQNHLDEERDRLLNVAAQKQDIMRLLLARQMAGDSPKGEAFFLLDFKWWRQWCEHVDFFYANDKNSQRSKERTARVLKLLPPGAVLPDEDGGSDDDDDDSSEESSSLKHLGPIDNSRLFIDENSTFHQQWFDTAADGPTLRPNSVRGYHFELLPREVYNALRSWYGEVTPSLCRRTTEDKVVVMYSHQSGARSLLSKPRCCACRAPGAVMKCKRCMSVQYCQRSCQEAHWHFHKSVCKALSSGNMNKSPPSHDGRVGLNNLGNTCFMNSALQCLSHATPLTRHFLSNGFKADLNTNNPLGTGGKLALAYDTVMKDIWMKVKSTATSPTALKRAIALFAPRFAGCLQHDAQEFLAYLLDGLHEDLNRIKKAPYVEMPDITDGHNMAVSGARAWDAHKRRNDSLVMDTFYGQFQSTCVCPKCQKVSVSFDAFNHVSLEIPQVHKTTVVIPVFVFAANSGEAPYRYGLTIERQCLISDLKRALSEMTGIPVAKLILADLYEHNIYELLNEKKLISSIRPNDIIAAFEVEPYTNSSIHVVTTHSIKEKDKKKQQVSALFGYPSMTSFDADFSCKQVWEHVCKLVSHLVCEEGAGDDGYVDDQMQYRFEDVLQIHIINNARAPREVFPSSRDDDDTKKTSLLPIDSSKSIREFLGEDCTENFLFLSLEWKDCRGDDESKLIDPEKFMVYHDHQTLIDAVRAQRPKNGVKGVTLDQCFESFSKPERLDENNMWYCSKCKEHVRALKTMKLWRLPNILVVHLKRFEFKHALRRDKLDTFVDFPLEGLDMNKYCANWKPEGKEKGFLGSTVPADYDLFGVVNHMGRLGFGHYTAFARRWDESSVSSDFALFDDSSVRNIGSGPEGIVSSAAYVLFYRRRTFN